MIKARISFDEKRIKDKTKEAIRKEMVKELNKIYADLVSVTPVDTGKAQRSWRIDFRNLTVENSAEYIGRLNAGSSSQAPKYFIERVVLKRGKPSGLIVNYNIAS